ncbi:hypothetical protein [Marinobacter sp. CA1]|uniref:hypothetical protein n=1 Tax=Marinobacter sp. CA1 TaxID=2817656 RepID=UPI001D075041|nr:hypothetical protein [Marinobacter sp. CA1]UDL06345.1 hypothetical protein J2887_06180 [Marinobacter sp. CA1]
MDNYSPDIESLEAFPLLTPGEMINLASNNDKDALSPGKPPLLTLHTANGMAVTGLLLKSNGTTALIALSDENSNVSGRLRYQSISDVSSVEIHHPTQLECLLMRNNDGTANQDPGTEQELNAEEVAATATKQMNSQLQTDTEWLIDHATFTENDRTAVNLRDLLDMIRSVLSKLCDDEVGRDAWSEIASVSIVSKKDRTIKVSRRENKLSIEVDLEKPGHSWTRQRLERELNHHL